MKQRLMYLAALTLLAPTPLWAQQANPAGTPGGATGSGGAGHDRLQMEEDIEIMRRLLGRALAEPLSVAFSPDGRILATTSQGGTGRLWGDLDVVVSPQSKTWATRSADGTLRLWDVATGKQLSGPPLTAHRTPNLEGVYLKGYGVVYTVTMPPLPHAIKTQAAKPAPKALSDWERVRKELRGDKADEAAPPPPAPPSLTDSILRVLAKNGRHFTALGDKEKITVVVTFRDPHLSTGQAATAAAATSGMPGMSSSAGMPGGPPGMTPGQGPFGQLAGKRHPQSARDHELMGDLHLKQNRTREAVDAYLSAIAALAHERGPATEAHKRSLYRKLAHTALLLADRASPGNQEKIIARALEWLRAAQGPKTAELAAPATRLPAKLIITVPKSALNTASVANMTEFRAAVSIETVPVAAPAKSATGKER